MCSDKSLKWFIERARRDVKLFLYIFQELFCNGCGLSDHTRQAEDEHVAYADRAGDAAND